MSAGFDAALPAPHSALWMDALRRDGGDGPRVASYQPPGGAAVPFVLDGFRFTGGQSKETAEYPFGGLWSNERLNERPHELSVEGFLRGAGYIARRHALVEALQAPTCDDRPGHLDLPFWGRFPVVVGAGYEVSERSDEQGQCRLSIPFTRAGASAGERSLRLDGGEAAAAAELGAATERARAAAAADFEARLDGGRLDLGTLRAGFGQAANALLAIAGRIQGPARALGMMARGAMGILGLISQGARLPREFALALFGSAAAVAGGIAEIKNGLALYGRGGAAGGAAPSLPPADNERSALLLFLSADSFELPGGAATAGQAATKSAVENLYKIAAYAASCEIMAGMDSPTRGQAAGYWRLLERLAESADMECPAVHAAVADTRAALSRALSMRHLGEEATRLLPAPAPLLSLARHLGCGEDDLRRLNRVADSFVMSGEVTYV